MWCSTTETLTDASVGCFLVVVGISPVHFVGYFIVLLGCLMGASVEWFKEASDFDFEFSLNMQLRLIILFLSLNLCLVQWLI